MINWKQIEELKLVLKELSKYGVEIKTIDYKIVSPYSSTVIKQSK